MKMKMKTCTKQAQSFSTSFPLINIELITTIHPETIKTFAICTLNFKILQSSPQLEMI